MQTVSSILSFKPLAQSYQSLGVACCVVVASLNLNAVNNVSSILNIDFLNYKCRGRRM